MVLKKSFRYLLSFTILLFVIALLIEIFNPYIFPSEISLFLDEQENLPIESKDWIYLIILVLAYISLFLFIPYSNYFYLLFFIYTYVDSLFISPELTISSPLFFEINNLLYVLTGITIYMIFFTPLSKLFKLKKNDQ